MRSAGYRGGMTRRLTPLRATLVALAALAGLFAMHALTHHGEHLPSHDAMSTHPVGHLMTAAPAAVATAAATPVSTEPGGSSAMCLAILLTGLLVWSAVRRPTGGLLLRPAHASALVERPRPTSRSHDPPSRWSLSVCRC